MAQGEKLNSKPTNSIMAQMNFGGVIETVVTSKEFSLEKAREVLKDEVIAVIGYGIQGPGQACNLRDN
jgi:ketol-acid reductoisomerase